MAKYTACICEGGAERAIFEEKYLKKGFSEKITVYRILDSHSENFKISKAYEPKVNIVNVITAPEIEMLIICNAGKYEDYKNHKVKPSVYCKSCLKLNDVKKYDFIQQYFSDINELIHALKEYRRIANVHKNEKTLWDLLKWE